jgi:hypothetical protein
MEAGKLKDKITAMRSNLEKKGYDKIQLTDYANYWTTSNIEKWLKLDLGDRRHLMVHCIERMVPVKFGKMYEDYLTSKYNEEDWINLHNYFKEYVSVDNENICSSSPPMTAYKRSCMMHTVPAYQQLLYKMTSIHLPKPINIFGSIDLYEMSITYAKDNKICQSYTNQTAFKYFQLALQPFHKRTKSRAEYHIPSCELLNIQLLKFDKDYYNEIHGLVIDDEDDLFDDESLYFDNSETNFDNVCIDLIDEIDDDDNDEIDDDNDEIDDDNNEEADDESDEEVEIIKPVEIIKEKTIKKDKPKVREEYNFSINSSHLTNDQKFIVKF